MGDFGSRDWDVPDEDVPGLAGFLEDNRPFLDTEHGEDDNHNAQLWRTALQFMVDYNEQLEVHGKEPSMTITRVWSTLLERYVAAVGFRIGRKIIPLFMVTPLGVPDALGFGCGPDCEGHNHKQTPVPITDVLAETMTAKEVNEKFAHTVESSWSGPTPDPRELKGLYLRPNMEGEGGAQGTA